MKMLNRQNQNLLKLVGEQETLIAQLTQQNALQAEKIQEFEELQNNQHLEDYQDEVEIQDIMDHSGVQESDDHDYV